MDATKNKKETKYSAWLSSDGKMTLQFGADTSEEMNNTFDKVKPLFEKMIKLMKDNDLQRKSSGGFPKKEPVVVGKCPKDGADLIQGVGKVKEKCSNNKYDFTLKKNVGSCDYVVWNS